METEQHKQGDEGDEAEEQQSLDQSIHYPDVDQSAVGTPTEGPQAVALGTESDAGRERREAREAEQQEQAEAEDEDDRR